MRILDYLKQIRPTRFFLITSVMSSVFFICFTPPFQIPDEPYHFFRAWQVSEGVPLGIKENNRVGGYLPNGLDTTVSYFQAMFWSNGNYKTSSILWNNLRGIKLELDKRKFVDFNTTAVYSPLSYLPQAAAIAIIRFFDPPPLVYLYGCRVASVLFWIIAIWFSLFYIPSFKWLFCLLALLPTSLYINCGMSSDVVTNGISFLLIAYVLYLKAQKSDIRLHQLIGLLLLAVFISTAKLVYAPLIILALSIDWRRIPGNKKYLIPLSVFISFAGAICWSFIIHDLQLSYDEYNPTYKNLVALIIDVDIDEQLQVVLHDPLRFLVLIFNSIGEYAGELMTGYTGTFGWLTFFSPFWLLVLLYSGIMLVAFFGGEESVSYSFSFRFMCLGIFSMIIILIFLSQYLVWTPVGAYYMSIQGRYLAPIFPLFFMILQTRHKKKSLVAFVTMSLSLLAIIYSTLQIKEWFIG